MEFEAIKDGKVVRTSFDKLANAGKIEGEKFVGLGSAPYEATYQDPERGTTRNVDLRQLAQASGLESVNFKFDRDKAVEQGFMAKEAKVDQGDVYNLERIKSEAGRMQYLTDKGFTGIVKSGEGYYGTKNGSIVPINATVGIGLDDVTRIGAHAGRDVGAAIGATAAVGAGIATGGLALAAGAASGAAGGVAGEAVQRLGDKVFGAEADKYNKQLGFAEEAKGVAVDGAVGAASFVGGQAIGRAGAALKGAAAKGLEAGAEKARALGANAVAEWGEGVAAKAQMSVVEQRLPGGAFSRFSSEENAAAQQLISAGNQKGITAGTRKEAAQAAEGIIDGSLRKGATASAEEQAMQAQLREGHEQIAKRAAQEAEKAKLTSLVGKTGRDEATVVFEERMKDRAKEVFPQFGKELDEVFAEKGSKEAADAARGKVESHIVDSFTKATGLKLEKDTAGKPVGIDQDSMRSFVSEKVTQTFGDAEDFIRSAKAKIAPGDVIPDSAIKQEVTSQLNATIGAVKDALPLEVREQTKKVIAAINKHADNKESRLALLDATDALEDSIRKNYGSGGVGKNTADDALTQLEEQLAKYHASSTSNVDGLEVALNVQKKYMSLKKMRADGVFDADGGTAAFMDEMKTLARVTGDDRASGITQSITALDMESTLRGKASPFRDLLEPGEREFADAFQFIRHNTIEKGAGEVKKGVVGKAVAHPMAEEGMELMAGLVPGGRSVLAAARLARSAGGVAGAAGSGVRAAAEAARGLGSAAASGTRAVAGNRTAQGLGTEEALSAMRPRKEEERKPAPVSRRVVNR